MILAAALASADAVAAPVEVCDLPPRYGVEATAAAIARTACQEHRLWLRPFIEADGRLAALAVTEAERARLDDGSTPAWQRVARYWRDSGTLAQLAGTPGASSCMRPPGERSTDNDCRAYLVDNPWSAAFISWVMTQSSVPGFGASPRHIDYIARAWRQPATSPYTYEDPATGKPAPGDLLCLLRDDDHGLGAAGLRAALSGQGRMPTRSHCDIVVAANVGGDRTLYLIGGNVLNAVMMRKLPLDRSGRLAPEVFATPPAGHAATAAAAAEPVPAAANGAGGREDLASPSPMPCSPGQPRACGFNQRDWAVLLRLKPQAQLDALAPPNPSYVPRTAPASTPAGAPEPAGAPAAEPPAQAPETLPAGGG